MHMDSYKYFLENAWIYLYQLNAVFSTESSEMPQLLQNSFIGLIAVIISLIIFLLNDIKALDRQVIMSKIFIAHWFLPVCLILLITPIFWNYIAVLIFIIHIIGFAFTAKILYRSYKWIIDVESKNIYNSHSYRNKWRKTFLSKCIDPKLWDTIWQEKIEPIDYEKDLIDTFFNFLTNHIRAKNKNSELVDNFLNNFNMRTLDNTDVIISAIFSNILNLRYSYFSYNLFKSKLQNVEYTEKAIEELLKNLIVTQPRLKVLFNTLLDHLKNKKDNYTDSLLDNMICTPILRILSTIQWDPGYSETHHERYNIDSGFRHNFPPEWKISASKDFHPIAEIWNESFKEWCIKEKGLNNSSFKIIAGFLFEYIDFTFLILYKIFIHKLNNTTTKSEIIIDDEIGSRYSKYKMSSEDIKNTAVLIFEIFRREIKYLDIPDIIKELEVLRLRDNSEVKISVLEELLAILKTENKYKV